MNSRRGWGSLGCGMPRPNTRQGPGSPKGKRQSSPRRPGPSLDQTTTSVKASGGGTKPTPVAVLSSGNVDSFMSPYLAGKPTDLTTGM